MLELHVLINQAWERSFSNSKHKFSRTNREGGSKVRNEKRVGKHEIQGDPPKGIVHYLLW